MDSVGGAVGNFVSLPAGHNHVIIIADVHETFYDFHSAQRALSIKNYFEIFIPITNQ